MRSGYILINKPVDWTSFDVVKKSRGILKEKKVGHIGTLDPFATGLLVLLINKATRLNQFLVEFDKEYIVTSKFGITTDTGDLTGKIIDEHVTDMICKEEFLSKIDLIKSINTQIPSKYSAIKINGKKAYKLAYEGKDFDVPERCILIKDFELLDYNFPFFKWKAVVSKGTYIRTLTEQIARLFGTIAVTTELERSKIADFKVENAVTIDSLYEGFEYKPIDGLLYHLDSLNLSDQDALFFVNGREFTIECLDSLKNKYLRIYHQEKFIGVGIVKENIMKAYKVIIDNE